jgi:cytoskeleton protein RodZ
MKRSPRPAEAIAADAARLGDELREARLTLGHSIEEMAATLRIRRVHLEALEEGRLRDLPGAAYAAGFVRSYAQALGLDADETARRFRDLTGPSAAKPKLVFPEPVPERGMPAGIVIGIGAAIAIGGYVAWFNLSGGGSRMVDVVPPIPPRLEMAAEQGRAQLPGAQPPGTLPLAALPPPGGANTSAQAATVPAAQIREQPAAAPAAPVAAAPAAAPPPAPAADGTRLILRARATSPDGAWVQVRDARGGQTLVNRVLRPGETWPVPLRDGLLLDTGKADGLEILLDGQPQPTLDGLVGVRRNIALEPDRVRQRIAPITSAATPTPTPARN